MGRLEVALNGGSLLQLYEAMWGPVYEAVLSILGSTGVVLPIGDPKHGKPDATTFKTVGDEQVTFTWSEAPNSFDIKLDLTDPAGYQGTVPIVQFNGTDEEADTPDAAFWSRGNGSTDSPFCVGAWVHTPSLSAFRTVLSKWDSGGLVREWQLAITDGNIFRFQTHDETNDVSARRDSDDAITTGAWTFLVAAYDGTGGSTAMNGVTLYADGSAVASTATNDASYVAMSDTAALPGLVFRPGASFFREKLAGGPLGPFFTQKELAADEVLRLYELGKRALALQ